MNQSLQLLIYCAIIISDLHLGSAICKAELIIQFLMDIKERRILTQRLILNGDVFDSWDFRRLSKTHWKVLSLLRSLSDDIEVIWVRGNHDGPADIVSHLIGVPVLEQYSFISGSQSILCLHGDHFDTFLTNHPILTWFGDLIYNSLQRINVYWARQTKLGSKTFLRCSELVECEALKYAQQHGYDKVCTGHTHLEIEKSNYCNSGSWTEIPCTYLAVTEGTISLLNFPPI